MSRVSFVRAEYGVKKRQMQRQVFVWQMDSLTPCPELEGRVAPHYGERAQGHPPYPLSVMLRVHFLQLFCNLRNGALKSALSEVESIPHFARVKLERVSDETTILNLFSGFAGKPRLGQRAVYRHQRPPSHQRFDAASRHESGCYDHHRAILDQGPSPSVRSRSASDAQGRELTFPDEVTDAVRLVHSVANTPAEKADTNVASRLLLTVSARCGPAPAIGDWTSGTCSGRCYFVT